MMFKREPFELLGIAHFYARAASSGYEVIECITE